MVHPITILIVDDAEDARWVLSTFVQQLGMVAVVAETGKKALAILAEQRVCAVLLDVRLKDMSGLEVLKKIRHHYDTPVILVTGYGSAEDAATALRSGAHGYLTKPYDHRILERCLRNVLGPFERNKSTPALDLKNAETLACLIEAMGVSKKAQRIVHSIKQVALTDLTVLLHGETGTGKELVSRAIHSLSLRREAAFVAIDCGAIPESLIESELFGHTKGAFTGADQARKGVFELARNGTLFLDEISSLPMKMQSRLMRVVESREFRPLGESRSQKLNARIIAASNMNLDQLIQNKEFRSDLFYRLNEYPIFLAPLRERKDDIPDLVRHFMTQERQSSRNFVNSISDEALKLLLKHEWPGNVRELRNVIRHALVVNIDQQGPLSVDAIAQYFELLSSTNNIGVAHKSIPVVLHEQAALVVPSQGDVTFPLEMLTISKWIDDKASLGNLLNTANLELEKHMLKAVLAKTNGNQALAARMLGIDYKTLQRKLKTNMIGKVGKTIKVLPSRNGLNDSPQL